MALSAWKGAGGGIIVSATPAIILCEHCPCSCVVSIEIPDSLIYTGTDTAIEFQGVWEVEVEGPGDTSALGPLIFFPADPGGTDKYVRIEYQNGTTFTAILWRISDSATGSPVLVTPAAIRYNWPGASGPWSVTGTLTLDDWYVRGGEFADAPDELDLVGC